MNEMQLETGTGIELARSYGDQVISFMTNDSRYSDLATGIASTGWNSPENIDSGKSGIILYLLKLYAVTGDSKYLEATDNAIDELLVYCANHPTHNYSLYTGRAGFAYALIQRYLVDGNKDILEQCIRLMEPATGRYLQSRYVSDYLYDGRSGTLLVLVHLYLLSGKESLLDPINKFVNTILSNAQLSENGIYWMLEEEIGLRGSAGFAHGAAGIQYVFRILAKYCKSNELSFIIEKAGNYIDSCWINELQNWGDFRRDITSKETLQQYRQSFADNDPSLFAPANDYGWANGLTGILLSAVTFGSINNEAVGSIKNIDYNKIFSDSLYEGLAGIGLFYEMAPGGNSTGEWPSLVDKLGASTPGTIHASGLMHGPLGNAYFLLVSSEKKIHQENILAPFANVVYKESRGQLKISIDLVAIKKTWLSKYFPRMIHLLDAIAPGILNEYLSAAVSSMNETKSFVSFIQQKIEQQPPGSLRECISDLLVLEKEKFEFFHSGKSILFLYLSEISQNEKILGDLNLSDEWLFNQVLSISPVVKIHYTKWNWNMVDEVEYMDRHHTLKKQLSNISSPPKEFCCLFIPGWKYENVEFTFQTVYRHILSHFNKPMQLGVAVAEFRNYLRSLPDARLKELLREVAAANFSKREDLLQIFDSGIITRVKMLIHRGVLQIVK